MPPVAGIGDSPLVPPPSDTRQHGGQAARVATPSERFEQSFSTVAMDVERSKFAENEVMYEFSLDRVSGHFKHMMEMLQNLKD